MVDYPLSFVRLLRLLLWLGISRFCEILEIVIHDHIHVEQVKQTSEQLHFGSEEIYIGSLNEKAFFHFIVGLQFAE